VEKENAQNGGNFDNDIIPPKKLSRYETFFNFILEHNIDGYLPANKEIYENLVYEGKNFTEFLVNYEKKQGRKIGDIVLDHEVKKFKLVRKEKY
jgi:ASC-1-like (ASCH) protein